MPQPIPVNTSRLFSVSGTFGDAQIVATRSHVLFDLQTRNYDASGILRRHHALANLPLDTASDTRSPEPSDRRSSRGTSVPAGGVERCDHSAHIQTVAVSPLTRSRAVGLGDRPHGIGANRRRASSFRHR
jgi:hypothetical protein